MEPPIKIKPVLKKKQVTSLTPEIRSKLADNFTKCVKGYHILHNDPVKEAAWEDINAQILEASECVVEKQSNGSHKPGADLSCSLGQFSNKTTQYETGNHSFEMSSYRLTVCCSDKNPGKIEDILAEIESRKNFKFYSILVREEEEKTILYDWYLIPSEYPQFNPSSYKWAPMMGKRGKNKDSVIGWETDVFHDSSMSITFSMSSQLWLDISITEEMKTFLIASCKVTRGRKLTFIQLFEQEEASTAPE
jgi:hypothetical protein